MLYKIRCGLLSKYLMEEINLMTGLHTHTHTHDTRSTSNFWVSLVTTATGKDSLFHRGLIQNNGLPETIKNS